MDLIEIHIPGSFIPERNYILSVIFGNFLGLDFQVKIHEETGSYLIKVPEGRDIIIKDHFFSGFSESSGYLHKSGIPDKVSYFTDFFPGYEDTPVLYGEAEVIFFDKYIQLKADIIASSFFMLTRWEENVIKARDKHGRFPGNESLAYKFNFLGRPVVNEYAEILWFLLCKAGFRGRRSQREFRITPTHDVDHIIFWDSDRKRDLIVNLAGDILKRKDILLSFRRLFSFFRTQINREKDPNITFNYLMSLAESCDCKALFYFFSNGDNRFDPQIYIGTPLYDRIIEEINVRMHNAGIHPSYDSYRNVNYLKSEIDSFKGYVITFSEESRQHYLRFEVPDTWQILDECGIKTDSSMYYSGFPGFRCGTCYEFKVFDITERKILDLTERPLLIMDTCLLKCSAGEARQIIIGIKEQVKKYKGNFVFNWHNSNVSWNITDEFRTVFEEEFYGR